MRILPALGVAAFFALAACDDDGGSIVRPADAPMVDGRDASAADAPCRERSVDGGASPDVVYDPDAMPVGPATAPGAAPFLRFVLAEGVGQPRTYACQRAGGQPETQSHGTGFSAGRARLSCFAGITDDDPSKVALTLEFPAGQGLLQNADGPSVVTRLIVGTSANYLETDCPLRQFAIRVATWDPITRHIVGDGWVTWQIPTTELRTAIRFDFDTTLSVTP